MSAYWRIAGPGLGPLRTTLASGRIGGTRRRRRAPRGWSRRFGTLWYWALGIWAIEAAFWLAYGIVMVTVAVVAARKARSGAGSITPR